MIDRKTKKYSLFIQQAAIPLLWLISTIITIVLGFDKRSCGWYESGTGYSYPLEGVVRVCGITAIESIILYLILRPRQFAWSIPKLGIALFCFIVFSVIGFGLLSGTCRPNYMGVPFLFAFPITLALSGLFLVAAYKSVSSLISRRK